ncbi:MAG: isocitrate/isopropylmalate dehydrogenase family protein [candidate division NC10 bacterium]|nr:isocitrate/isopropylmalate dehydrogenase family protein [candidate division NC10 bacterium]MBI2454752.1 isocitrate/isopropylmalate dehydrogenase family protein [candidate division NC10 bacterium]
MQHTVALIPGDGIGPEAAEQAVRILNATGVSIEWETVEAGHGVSLKYGGDPLPESTLAAIRRHRVALKGPLTTEVVVGRPSVNVALRKGLDLYACVRPIKTLPGVASRYTDVDMVVIRENTEDLYCGIEHLVIPGVVETLKLITEKASLRIAQYAFDLARRERRNKVTAIHKANIMKLSDGLFLECCRRVAREYPEIAYAELIVDNACMQLVRDPSRFDVLLMANLYGDIISDLGAGLVGGLGVVPGANIGEEYAVFEAVHGSAPDIAGKGIANPLAITMSGGMMLKHLGEEKAAQALDEAIQAVLKQGRTVTRDLGGTATTREMADAIMDHLAGI